MNKPAAAILGALIVLVVAALVARRPLGSASYERCVATCRGAASSGDWFADFRCVEACRRDSSEDSARLAAGPTPSPTPEPVRPLGSVPAEERDARCMYSADGVLIRCEKPDLPRTLGDQIGDLEIVKFSAQRGRSGFLAEWTVSVKNNSKTHTYKDVHFKTEYFGESGTKIDRSWLGHTEYRLFPPGKTIVVKFKEFAHSQAAKISVEIDGVAEAE